MPEMPSVLRRFRVASIRVAATVVVPTPLNDCCRCIGRGEPWAWPFVPSWQPRCSQRKEPWAWPFVPSWQPRWSHASTQIRAPGRRQDHAKKPKLMSQPRAATTSFMADGR
eukprot:4482602-Prymnesium_polylepis.1